MIICSVEQEPLWERAGSLPQKQGFIHPLNVDHHGNKLQKPSLADYG
jgi:hypothetical protein